MNFFFTIFTTHYVKKNFSLCHKHLYTHIMIKSGHLLMIYKIRKTLQDRAFVLTTYARTFLFMKNRC